MIPPFPEPRRTKPAETMAGVTTGARPALARRLGLGDAVVLGLGSMLGAGVFTAFAPAARAAGSGLLVGLAVAAVVAYCNALSSARLAALYPESGGTYVYGRRRLGDFWGHLAGWSFVVGKTASCAAMALTVAAYATPGHLRSTAVAAVLFVVAVDYLGVQKSAHVVRAVVAFTVVTLVVVVVVAVRTPGAGVHRWGGWPIRGSHGVLQSAGLLFFAFAGYARIATLGEEVRNPSRTIPRAITVALGVTVLLYAVVAASALLALGPAALGATTAPLRAVVEAGGHPGLASLVRLGACVAALGSLLSLVLGVSRTSFAMARDGHLPRALAAVHPTRGVPHRAALAVGAVVAILVLGWDVRGAIGFSSFAVLIYYAVANASACTLPGRARERALPVLGLGGCIVLAFSLPVGSVACGAGVVSLGALSWLGRTQPARRRATS